MMNLYMLSLPLGNTAFFISNELTPDEYQAVQDIVDKAEYIENRIDGFTKTLADNVFEKLNIVIQFLPVSNVFRKFKDKE